MLYALPLLRFHEIDALPLAFGEGKNQRAIFGFSCLARMLLLGPRGFQRFLTRPCEEASEPIAVVSARNDLSSLLETFAETRFGFARVEDGSGAGALASLSDFLGLYGDGKIRTALKVGDVASDAFSMPRSATLREAFEQMFSKRYRRIFMEGSRDFVSDRRIIEHVFSPAVLRTAMEAPASDILSTRLSEIDATRAKNVSPRMTLREAARLLKDNRGQCLVFGGKLVTPWDLVMKPWKLGNLRIARTAHRDRPRRGEAS